MSRPIWTLLLVASVLTSGTSSDTPMEEDKAKMKSLHVESVIKYRYARTVVTSTVLNTADKAEEIFFHVILPESAFISEFQMEIEGKTYKAHIKEKEEAKAEYSQAVAAGRTAGHVAHTVRDSNKFTVSVNVESNKEVIFKLTYEELLKRELSAYKHCVNIDPGQIVEDLKLQVTILESTSITRLEVPPLRESSELGEEPVKTDDSLVKIERPSPAKAVIHWAPSVEEQEKLNKSGVKGQLVVRYDVDRLSKSEQVLINNGYFVHFFAPSNLPPLRKHVTFVLDVSGSMSGRKLQQLIEAMNTILSDVNEDDFFSIVLFSTSIFVWDPTRPERIDDRWNYVNTNTEDGSQPANTTVVSASSDNIQKAKDFINKLRAHSCTNIYGALLKAIELVSLGKIQNIATTSGQVPEPMIIFLTDGQPSGGVCNTEQIISEATTRNKDVGAAVFSLGFGGDADMNFLRKLSLKNSGFAQKIYEASDAALQLKNFYLQVACPLLSKVKFSYQDDKIDASSITRTSFPTLFNGSELVVIGRVHGNDLGGELFSHSREGSCVRGIVHPDILSEKTDFMERMWAYLTIQQLLDSATAVESEESSANKKKALELALKYSFVTTLTSLVVVKPDNKETDVGTERADDSQVPSYAAFSSAPLRRVFYCRAPMRGYDSESADSPEFSHIDSPIGDMPSYCKNAYSDCDDGVAACFYQPQNQNHELSPFSDSDSDSTCDNLTRDPKDNCSHSSLLSQILNPHEKQSSQKRRCDSPPSQSYLLHDSDLSTILTGKKKATAISKDNGLVLSSIEFISNIQCQRATTEIIMEVSNPKNDFVQGDFQIPLRSDVVIVRCILVADEKTITAEQKMKDEIEGELSSHLNNAAVVSRAEEEEGICVTLCLVKNKTVTVKITYEELLTLTDQHCTFILPSNIVANKISASLCINECSNVEDVKWCFDNAEGSVVSPDIDTSSPNKVVISWIVDVEKQDLLKSAGSSGKFSVIFKVDNASFDEKLVDSLVTTKMALLALQKD